MKRQFFRSKFIMFISLTLVPICIFGFLSVFYISNQVREEAREKTQAATDLMTQYMDELTQALEFYRISFSSDARLHLAAIEALNNDSMGTASQAKLTQAMKSLYYAQSTKPYIQSLFLTMEGSRYYINGINRETFEGSLDSTWADEVKGEDGTILLKVREVKKNKFDTYTVPVVTVYQRMKYHELIAVNLKQDYFNRWLDSITAYEGQALAITGSDGQILFYNHNADALKSLDSTETFINTGSFPGIYGLNYISLIPQKEVFKLSNTILKLTVAAGLISIFLSSVLAYFYTRRDYRQIEQIISLFETAEKGEFKPQQPVKMPNHAYFHIITNIINLFMSQTYLKVQLDAKKYALSTAQLSALQYQLNPHFLFNTLQSIDLEVLKLGKGPTAANHMISALSELLRYSLDEPMKQVSLREEIEATKNYIDLQQCRLGEEFTVIWEYPEEILSHPMLRLLLQPIIENCIAHSQLPCAQELKIKIRIRIISGLLSIRIIDNGRGMSKEKLAQLAGCIADDQVEPSGRHIGLKNISQRVRLSDPNGRIRVWSREGLGTIVEIIIH